MTELFTLQFAGVDFKIRRADGPSFMMFGVRKSGSSIMNAMVAALAQFNGVTYVDIAGLLFAKGVTVAAWQNNETMATLLQGGNLFGGFRNAPLGILRHPVTVACKKILLVRDPRDALVSEYFSSAYSHSIPEEGEGREQMLENRTRALQASIGEYVLREAQSFARTLQEYDEFLKLPGLRLYRYEDAIMQKRRFLTDICAHFGWTIGDGQLSQILGWADVMPAEERPTSFVRKVTPGDHREKLDAATIAQLNSVLARELRTFGYA